MIWIESLIKSGARHYTCTSNKEFEVTPGSKREHISYRALMPQVISKLGREPADYNELIIVAEQILREKSVNRIP